MQKIKNYIVHKLGGFFISDFPPEIRSVIIRYNMDKLIKECQKRMDTECQMILKNGFTTKYTNEN